MAIRFPAGDWVKQVEAFGSYLDVNSQFVISDQALVLGGSLATPPTSGETGADSLILLSLHDGSEIKTINVVGIGGHYFYNGDLAVDQNGYIWTMGATGFGAWPAAQVIDTENETIIASIGSQATNYGGGFQVFDPGNNKMWQYKNTTTLGSFNTVTYAESTTITDRADGGIAIDTDRNEIWVFNTTANTIKRYNATTGTLIASVTASFTLNSTTANYISATKQILVRSSSSCEIWSTETFSLIRTITAGATKTIAPTIYHAGTESFFGNLYDSSTNYSLPTLWANYSPYNTSSFALELLGVPDTDLFTSSQWAIDSKNSIYVLIQDDTGASTVFWVYKFAYTVGTDGRDTVVGAGTITGDSGLFTDIPDMFNRELILDLDLGAFYINDLGHTGFPAIVDYVELPGFALGSQDETIMVGNDVVLVTSGETGIISGIIQIDRSTEPRGEHFKYVTLADTSFTLAEYKDFTFKDYVSYDGVGDNFYSYILTGYDMSQDMMRKKRSIYLMLFNERTETIYTLDSSGDVVLARQSGCLIQSQWEWNTSIAQGKWGRTFQAYRLLRDLPSIPSAGDTLDYGERVIVTKNKLRGVGRSLSLLISSDTGKDMKLLGWALDNTKQDFV